MPRELEPLPPLVEALIDTIVSDFDHNDPLVFPRFLDILTENPMDGPCTFSDFVRALCREKFAPGDIRYAIQENFTIDGVTVTESDVEQGLAVYLQRDIDVDVPFGSFVAEVDAIARGTSKMNQHAAVRDAILKYVHTSREVETIAQKDVKTLAFLIEDMSEDLRQSLVSGLGLFDTDNRKKLRTPATQQQRLAVGLIGSTVKGWFYEDEMADTLARSYSPGELGAFFGQCVPPKLLPNVLARTISLNPADTREYDFIFHPGSEELLGLGTEERNKLARRFMFHAGLQLREHGKDTALELTRRFGPAIGQHPDFNKEIIAALGKAFSREYPRVRVPSR